MRHGHLHRYLLLCSRCDFVAIYNIFEHASQEMLLFTTFWNASVRFCCYLYNVFEQLAQQMLLFATLLNAVMHFCCYLLCFSLLLMLRPHLALSLKASCEPKHRIKKTIGQYEYGRRGSPKCIFLIG